jgi:hypothetical protein
VKDFTVRLLLAAAVTLIGFVLTSSAQTQSDDKGSTAGAQQPTQQNDAQTPSPGDTQTQDAHAFTGRVVKEKNGQLVLKDPVTKVSYQFNDQSKAKPYIGKQVKVTGKLDLNSNTIHIEGIEPLS